MVVWWDLCVEQETSLEPGAAVRPGCGWGTWKKGHLASEAQYRLCGILAGEKTPSRRWEGAPPKVRPRLPQGTLGRS